MAVLSFLSSAAGRILRISVGLALIAWGIFLTMGASTLVVGIILAVVGLLPLVAGLADVCVFAPLFGAPFRGVKVRAHAQ